MATPPTTVLQRGDTVMHSPNEHVSVATQSALVGSRKLQITFWKDTHPADVGYLLGMHRGGIVELSPDERANLLCFVQSGDWGHDSIRTVQVTMTASFDEYWFISRLGRCLEKIETVS